MKILTFLINHFSPKSMDLIMVLFPHVSAFNTTTRYTPPPHQEIADAPKKKKGGKDFFLSSYVYFC